MLEPLQHPLESVQMWVNSGGEHNNNHWKVLGALQSPKGIQFHSNNPKGVQNMVLGQSASVMGTWL